MIGLNVMSGAHFQRVGGLIGGVSQTTVSRSVLAFARAVNEVIRPQVLHLPDDDQMRENARKLEEKYHLPGFAFGVDGVFLNFDGKPLNIPPNTVVHSFFSRKFRYAINAQVVGGPDRLIYDLELGAPGSWNDASVWRQSDVKKALERRCPRFRLAGDSGYPRSVILITPFSQIEGENDMSKRLFNLRHSGLRAECTENIFGMWKRRFPIVRNIRNHYPNAIEIIMATAVLHNLSVLWKEPLPDDDGHNEDGEDEEDNPLPPMAMAGGGDRAGRLRIRLEGTAMRDTLLANMPQATPTEARRIRQRP